jgi:hypothetical protein
LANPIINALKINTKILFMLLTDWVKKTKTFDVPSDKKGVSSRLRAKVEYLPLHFRIKTKERQTCLDPGWPE